MNISSTYVSVNFILVNMYMPTCEDDNGLYAAVAEEGFVLHGTTLPVALSRPFHVLLNKHTVHAMKRFTFYGCSDACRLTRVPAVRFWSYARTYALIHSVHMPVCTPYVLTSTRT